MKYNHKNQRGAIAILCLAGILVTMMMAWVIFDAGPATREKYQLQAAADAAAYSQAAVKARSMNMVIYGNVAKRSIYSIATLYPSMWAGYLSWWIYHGTQCFKTWPNISSCIKWFRNLPTIIAEALSDFQNFHGGWTGFLYLVTMWFITNGNQEDHHFKDMLAIDNYQLYTMGVTPWWAWTEGAVRGIRNGATASTSFPPPAGQFFTTIPQLINQLFSFLSSIGIGSGPLYNSSGKADAFPVERVGSYWDVIWSILDPTSPAFLEAGLNVLAHRNASGADADSGAVIAAGLGFLPLHYLISTWTYPEAGKPFDFTEYSSLGAYLADTSYISYTYKQNQDRFNADRQKYNYLPADYEHSLGAIDDFTYKAGGLWAMSRAEISYQGNGAPDKWIPSWTARMRPIALPSEWDQAGYDVNATYHDILPYLAVLSVVGGSFSGSSLLGSIQDLAMMERNTRGMGASTIRGVAK